MKSAPDHTITLEGTDKFGNAFTEVVSTATVISDTATAFSALRARFPVEPVYPGRSVIVRALRQTSFSCPSEWVGVTTEGQEVYVRYRWGILRIDLDDNVFFQAEVGDPFDGVLTYAELRERTTRFVTWPEHDNAL